MVVNEASGEAHFIRMEWETRRLTYPRSHESFVTLNCADLSAVEAVNRNILTRTEMKMELCKKWGWFKVSASFTMRWCQRLHEPQSTWHRFQLTSFVPKFYYECRIVLCHHWSWKEMKFTISTINDSTSTHHPETKLSQSFLKQIVCSDWQCSR